MTLALLVAVWLIRVVLNTLSHALSRATKNQRIHFWSRQTVNVITTAVFIIVLVSIWFDNAARLTSFAAFLTAGLAFALQKVITAFAGYLVILRGNTFSVGDRILMGGVRGDVIALDFVYTTIMEMGQPPGEQGDEPSMWVRGRQFSGRIVSVNNGEIFNTPIYNYTRDFPYIWEEMDVPIPYNNTDRATAEQILLDAGRRHALTGEKIDEAARAHLRDTYGLEVSDIEPRVYYRITDNWVEFGLRFLVPDRGSRSIKDAMSREILERFEKANISIASGTYDIVGFPPLRLDDRFISAISGNGKVNLAPSNRGSAATETG
jgi:small-conductance mechanosensitive channel